MGYLFALAVIVVVAGLLLLAASRRRSRQEPERDPESAGTGYEEPQDEGRV